MFTARSVGCSHLRAALLFESCRVSVKRALLRAELGDPPRTLFDVTSDACPPMLTEPEPVVPATACSGSTKSTKIPGPT